MSFGTFVNEIDHFIEWHDADGKTFYFQIEQVEPFNMRTQDLATNPFSAVANGLESDWKQIPDLEPDTDQLHQCLWGIKDGARYFAKIPHGTNRYGVHEDVDVGYIDNIRSPYVRPSPNFQFWLKEGMWPAFNCDNDSGVSVNPKIWVEGWKFKVKTVTKEAVGNSPVRKIINGLTTA